MAAQSSGAPDCRLKWLKALTEAEYIALSQAMQELIPLGCLLLELAIKRSLPQRSEAVIKSTVFKDNNGAIATATTMKMKPPTKPIAAKYQFFKSYLKHENINMKNLKM
jgi:hypothetical protein